MTDMHPPQPGRPSDNDLPIAGLAPADFDNRFLCEAAGYDWEPDAGRCS